MACSVSEAACDSGGEAESTAASAYQGAASEEVDSTMDRAAGKIQAAFRGYSVRRRKPLNHLRKIANVRRALNELQEKAGDPLYIEKICSEVMECRKFTEGIMALLFQLDALQGVHPVVRDIRKSVNREVVQFMEVIDAIVVGAASSPREDSWNTPNIVRSNSISHIDRTLSYPLRRNFSLDNHVYPEQSYKLKSDRSCIGQPEGVQTGGDADSPANEKAEHSCEPIPGGFSGEPEKESPELSRRRCNCNEDPLEDDLARFDSSSAALLIQSRFRGYRVRRTRPLKHLRSIAVVQLKLRELWTQVSDSGFPAKLQSDNMERLKLTESITALLLQLDSVQGVDQVVRDIRKSVTREVIMLQEVVDTLIYEAERAGHSMLSERSSDIRQENNLSEERAGEDSLCNDDGLSNVDELKGEKLGEQPTHAEPLNLSSLEGEVGKPGLANLDFDRQSEIDRGAVDLSNECNSSAKDLEYQVRVLETISQTSSTSCCATEWAEENVVNDEQSGPCAAVVSGKDYSCRVNDEQRESVAALDSDSPVLDGASCKELHYQENISKRLGNDLCDDNVVKVVDTEAFSLGLHDHAGMEELQEGEMSLIGKAPLMNKSVSSISQDLDTGTCGAYLKANSLDQRIERFGTTFSASPVEQLAVSCDGAISVDVIETDLILQKYNFVPSSPAGSSSSLGESVPNSYYLDQREGEHLLPCESHAEQSTTSDKQCLGKLHHRVQKLPDMIHYCESRGPPAGVAEFRTYNEAPDLPQPCSECSSLAENVKDNASEGVKTCVALTKQKGDDNTFLPDPCPGNEKPSGFTGTCAMTVIENGEYQEAKCADFVRRLVEENTRLRTLLSEVLIFAEMQTSCLSTAYGQIEKMESEATQVKKREDIWLKKSKTSRRRR